MPDNSPFYLIVGLGNPGRAYEDTRHNIGFQVVDTLAEKLGLSFRKAKAFHGLLAEGNVGEKKIILLKPQTYMNSSGESVKICSSYYKVPTTQILVVSDDIYLAFGRLRIKTSGGSGGHNGLKSIESHLGTQVYMRLRVGISNKDSGDLADYVLSPFLEEEKQRLPDFVKHAAETLELWLGEGVVSAMQHTNTSREEKKPEKKLGE
jgi:peptidyl-tRNA hydrolase, PTH1 family